MGWSRYERLRFAESLDRTKRRVTAFYRRLLILIAVIFIGFVAVVVWRADSPGSQGEWFYFGIFVLLVLGWIWKQLRSLRPSPRPEVQIPPIRTRVEELDGGKRFELTIGTPPDSAADPGRSGPGEGDVDADAGPPGHRFTFSRSFQGEVPLPSFLRKRLLRREEPRDPVDPGAP